MSNANRFIRLTVSPDGLCLIGCDVVAEGSYEMALGRADIFAGHLTGAIREFGLTTAVAPGEWPDAHEQVTCDDDPRRSVQ